MATTIANATMTVTITEAITLNGTAQGATNTLSLPDIDEISKRIVTVPTSEKSIISFHASDIGPGTFIEGDVRYVRITNKDDTNFVILNIEGDASTDFSVRLDAGVSYIIASTIDGTGVVDYIDISGATLEDMTTIKATADTAACDVEILVASV
jgi:hypothetical protein